MAKLNVMREPEGEMTTATPSVGLDPKAQSAGGAMIESAGDAFSALGEKFDQMRDHSEITKAKAEGIKAMDDIHVKAMSDPDVWGAPEKVKDQLDNLKDTLASKITSPDARNKFTEEWDVEAARKYVDIHNQLRAKQIDAAQATTFEYVDSKSQEYVAATNNDARTLIKQQIVDQVSSAVKGGYMHAEKARAYLVSHLGKLATEQVETDLNHLRNADNPQATYDTIKSELDKGKDGMYPDLTEKQRGEFLDKAARVYAKADEIKTEVGNSKQNIRAESFATQLSSGTLDMPKLNEARANNHITAEDYKNLYDNLLAKNSETAGTDHEAMYKLESDILGTMKEGELTKDRGLDWPSTRRAIIQANTDGKISKNDMDKLLEYHLMPQQDMMKKLQDDVNQPKNDTEFLKQQNEKKGAVTRRQEKIANVQEAFKNYAGDDKRKIGHLTVDHMNEVKDSKVTDDYFMQACQKVIAQDSVNTNPYVAQQPEEGGWMMDTKGVVEWVYPNGKKGKK